MTFVYVAKKVTHPRINNCLAVFLCVLSGYIIAWPFLPSLNWWANHSIPVVSARINPVINVEAIPDTNTLVIPGLSLREEILEGSGIETVNRGVWRRPLTSTPDSGGNTVLVGHRFTYSGKSVFYNLDKVRVGDEIRLYWNNKEYIYITEEIQVVSPDSSVVEAETSEPRLTLYTCTPLLTAKDRLVVKAKLQ